MMRRSKTPRDRPDPKQRRFPPPLTAELQPNHYVVRDANRQQLAYVYYESEPGRRSAAKIAFQRRGAADRGKYREIAGVVWQGLNAPPLGEAMSPLRTVAAVV